MSINSLHETPKRGVRKKSTLVTWPAIRALNLSTVRTNGVRTHWISLVSLIVFQLWQQSLNRLLNSPSTCLGLLAQKLKTLFGDSFMCQSWTSVWHFSSVIISSGGKWKSQNGDQKKLTIFRRYLYCVLQCTHLDIDLNCANPIFSIGVARNYVIYYVERGSKCGGGNAPIS